MLPLGMTLGLGMRAGTSAPSALALVSASVNGSTFQFNFNRPAAILGGIENVAFSGSRSLSVLSFGAPSGNSISGVINESAVEFGETFVVDITGNTFQDSAENFLPAVSGRPVTNATPGVADVRVTSAGDTRTTNTGDVRIVA